MSEARQRAERVIAAKEATTVKQRMFGDHGPDPEAVRLAADLLVALDRVDTLGRQLDAEREENERFFAANNELRARVEALTQEQKRLRQIAWLVAHDKFGDARALALYSARGFQGI